MSPPLRVIWHASREAEPVKQFLNKRNTPVHPNITAGKYWGQKEHDGENDKPAKTVYT